MEKLNNIPDKNPFRVPENYIEEVNRKILASTTEAVTGSKKRGLYPRIRPFLAAAASVAILIAVAYSVIKISGKVSDRKNSGSEINIREFAETYLYDIDLTTLEQKSDPLFMQGSFPELTESEIIDNLLLENINENEIYELL